MPKKKKPMQWEVRKLSSGKWGIFLQQQFCRTDEPVCYGASVTEEGAATAVERMNQRSIEEWEDEQ
tara:strand:+ start:850 stop:1047 length:198 start_codon:yes stop_codon:yes gene_type:complete